MTTAVIGAGPAGLIAALTLDRDDPGVVLIDEQPHIGGHLRYDPYLPGNADQRDIAWREELDCAITSSAIKVRTSTVVWAAYRRDSGFELMLSSTDGPTSLAVDKLILATGTTDRELNVAGSTLPGVMTERACRILIESYGVIPGARFVVVGEEPSRIERLCQVLATRNLSAIAILTRDLASIGGNDGVEFVTRTSGERLPADVVVIAEGERPDLQLAGMLGIATRFVPESDGWYLDEMIDTQGVAIIGGARLGPASPARLISNTMSEITQLFGTDVQVPDGLVTTSAVIAGGRTNP